jgi:selenoprotein W-related protein
LIEGSGGVFDVKVDDKLIYSKFQTGRFPEHDEILAELNALVT